MIEQSNLMKFVSCIGFNSIAWSLRRLHCPVKPNDLVLEVGSGGNPYFRSNVLLDAYEETRERHWVPLVCDRPTILGFVEDLPFQDKAFDFVIASHVLEHSTDPARFLSELQRVAKAGYIEVPDAFMERINPYRDHRLEITSRDDCLVIRKKSAWCVDHELLELYEDRVKRIVTRETMPKNPFIFHVRYFWRDHIDYKILNPDIHAGWEAPACDKSQVRSSSIKKRMRSLWIRWIRALFSQHHRNKNINLMKLLACPSCKSANMLKTGELIKCSSCGQSFSVRNGFPVMYKLGTDFDK